MIVVALAQNVKTYPTTQCKFLLIFKNRSTCIDLYLLDIVYWIKPNILIIRFNMEQKNQQREKMHWIV